MFPEVNFKVFADNWYELNIKNVNISDTTKSDYKYYLYSNIIPYFEKFKLCDITEDDCQRFLNKYVGYSKAKSTLAPDLEPYLLRHTFCTDCQAAGVPINVAKELMGHSDISVTAKIYTHMVDEVFEQNRQRLAEFTENKFKTA